MLLMKISSMTMVSQFWVTAVTEKGEGRSSQVSFKFLAFLKCGQHWLSKTLKLVFQVVSKTPGPRHLSMITSIGREVFQVL